MSDKKLSAPVILGQLQELADVNCFWVAYSGGVDSHVLLFLLAQIREQLKKDIKAVHINHGIYDNAQFWQQHCQQICQAMEIDFYAYKIDARPVSNESPEARARDLRYEKFLNIIDDNDVLLTAHHLDDQAETVILQLLRGAGPEGLSAMPYCTGFGNGRHARPLLSCTRRQIESYAKSHDLVWIKDHSNESMAFDRNYVRHEIMPLISRRWPGSNKTLGRVARHQAKLSELLEEFAAQDLDAIKFSDCDALKLDSLMKLSDARQKNLFRYWLKMRDLTIPSAEHLQRIQSDIMKSATDRIPCVNWPGCEVRRYRNAIFAMVPLTKEPASTPLMWSLSKPLKLDIGELSAKASEGQGIKAKYITDNKIEVRFRHGGEKIKPSASTYTRDLKKLFQERGVLPWYRDRLPLLYINGKLAAVPGFWTDHEYTASGKEAAWDFKWLQGIDNFSPNLNNE